MYRTRAHDNTELFVTHNQNTQQLHAYTGNLDVKKVYHFIEGGGRSGRNRKKKWLPASYKWLQEISGLNASVLNDPKI